MDENTSQISTGLAQADPIQYECETAPKILIANAVKLDGKPATAQAAATLPSVRFDVVVRANKTTLVRVQGWRVVGGDVLPPARRVGRGYVPVAFAAPAFLDWLRRAVQLWKDVPAFAEVTFPPDATQVDDDGEDEQFVGVRA